MFSQASETRVVVCGDTPLADKVAIHARSLGAVHMVRTRPETPADPAGGLNGSPLAVESLPQLCFVDFESDLETAAVVEMVLAQARDAVAPQIVAQIRDRGLRQTMHDHIENLGIRPTPVLFDAASIAAAKFARQERLHEVAYWRGQDRLHAVILGFTAVGRACLDELINAGMAGDLTKPRITILDTAPARVRATLALEMPEIGASADIEVGALDVATLGAPDASPLVAAEGHAPLTAIVIALDDPQAGLAHMRAVRGLQAQTGRAVAGVFLVTEQAIPAIVVPSGRAHDIGRRTGATCGLAEQDDILDLLTSRADELPRRIHERFRVQFASEAKTVPVWEALPETLRDANRHAARHLPLKLWTAGLHDPGSAPDMAAVTQEAFAAIVKPCIDQTSEDALMRRLARLEHDRWCAERRLDGWRCGATRDDELRHHPALVPFDDHRFLQVGIAKDVDQVKFLFEKAVTIDPAGAAPPIVLGLSSGEPDEISVDPSAALKLCEHGTWRPVVIVCGLLDAVEVARVDRLAAHLDAANMRWRLVIPEVDRDNAGDRSVSAAAIAALVQRPSTIIAPIGGAVDAAADDWVDSNPERSSGARIRAYIRSRVGALVRCPHQEDGDLAAA